MKNMKISKKLILSFLIITAFSVVLACVGIFSTTSINGNYVYFLNGPLNRKEYLQEMQTDFMTMRYRSANYVMNSGDAEFIHDTLVPQYQGAYADFQTKLAAYMQSNLDDTRREPEILKENNEKAARLGELIEQYGQASETALSHALAGNAQSADEVLKDVIPLSNEISALMDELIVPATFFVEESAVNMSQSATIMMAAQVCMTVVCVVVALRLAFYISQIISKPVSFVSTFLNRFGNTGNLEMTDEDLESYENRNQDEIGCCQEDLYLLAWRLIDISDALDEVAGGDLSVDLSPLSEHDRIGLAVNKMVESLNTMFGEVRTASGQVSTASEQISQAAQNLASGSSQQAASIQEFTATLAELQEQIDLNAKSSSAAREANEKAGSQLKDSMRFMDKMLEAMKGIDESSNSITKVIKVIDDIAFQTNILALNAAVEAARAGQHGKGFAVVADEVRNLASKSASAAKETAALIKGSSERVREGDQIVAKTNASLKAVSEYAQELARLMDGVAAASAEQARSIKEISQGIEQISTVVQANSATAEESAATAQEMSAQAVVLNENMAKFRLKSADSQRSDPPETVEIAGLRLYKSKTYPNTEGFALSHEKY